MNSTKNILLRIWVEIRKILSLTEYIDVETASQNIKNAKDFKGPNVYILIAAIFIASVGLNVNSIAVIIGAMLISPLMGPIIAIGYGLGIHDTDTLKKSGKNFLIMVTISIITSCAYFLLSPLELENPSELLARTNPTLFDVLIAIFGGFAGILEICRKDKGTVFSGVAIATALMPPLCTAGYGLANLNFAHFIGALYLFFINSIFISLATFITVKSIKFPATKFTDPEREKKVTRIITVLTILIIIPSIISAINVIKENDFAQRVSKFIANNKTINKSYIYDYTINSKTNPPTLEISLAGGALSDDEIEILLSSAGMYGLEKENIKIIQQAAMQGNEFNETEIVKSIFERNDNEILKKDKYIRQIEQELRLYKKKDIPVEQMSRELRAQYPSIVSLSIARGQSISSDTTGIREQVIFIIGSTSKITGENLDQLEKWLKIRIDFDNLKIINEIVPEPAKPAKNKKEQDSTATVNDKK